MERRAKSKEQRTRAKVPIVINEAIEGILAIERIVADLVIDAVCDYLMLN